MSLTVQWSAPPPGGPARRRSGRGRAMAEVWFCLPCGADNVTSCDDERCCLSCGCDLVSDEQMKGLLERVGVTVCTAAERKVLEACAALPKWHVAHYSKADPNEEY